MSKAPLQDRLAKYLNLPSTLAMVGRMESWVKDPNRRYPVSCTVLSVEDSMEGQNGIEYSWSYVSKGLRYASGVALDLSKLRAKSTVVGMYGQASGPVSFCTLYSAINQTLRRGGEYKNGAVVLYLDIAHPDIEEFLNLDRTQIPWAKRAVYVTDYGDSNLKTHPLKELILQKVADGSIWLAKKRYEDPSTGLIVKEPPDPSDPYKYRVYSQVCTEVLLPSNGTCMLLPVNLGQCTLKNLRRAHRNGMTTLCNIHKLTGVGKGDSYYLSPKVDKQVGLGAIGLANLLARYSVTYVDFVSALQASIDLYHETEWYAESDPKNKLYSKAVTEKLLNDTSYSVKAIELASTLVLAYHDASIIASKAKMKRAFAIAPTASVSYRNVDLDGYTTTPEISPPVCHPETKRVTRFSSEFGSQTFQYPRNVEVAEKDVSFETYFDLANQWQRLMNIQGLAHAISFNVWDCDIPDFIDRWLDSELVSTYYRLTPNQDFLDKSSVSNFLGNTAEQLSLDLSFEADESNNSSEQEYCFISKSASNDPNYCEACGG